MSDVKELRRAGVSEHRARKGDLELVVEARPYARHKRTSVLASYHRQDKISDDQRRAGERLASDWARSGLDPWATSPDTGVATVPGSRSPGQGPRYAEYNAAMIELGTKGGMLVQWVVRGTCIDELSMLDLARAGTDNRTVFALLRRGLDILGRHYARS